MVAGSINYRVSGYRETIKSHVIIKPNYSNMQQFIFKLCGAHTWFLFKFFIREPRPFFQNNKDKLYNMRYDLMQFLGLLLLSQ